MGLIDQEQVVAFVSLAKESLQMRIGIKDIIIVADHGIYPGRYIQPQFKGTDLPFFCLLLDHFPDDGVSGGQKLIDGIVDPIEMPFRIGTGVRVALRLFTEADLFLCRQHDHLHPERLVTQGLESLPGHGPGDGLGRQIKELLA